MQEQFDFMQLTATGGESMQLHHSTTATPIATFTKDYIMIHDESGRELLSIQRDGTVRAKTLLDASEAGRIFVQAVVSQLSVTQLKV